MPYLPRENRESRLDFWVDAHRTRQAGRQSERQVYRARSEGHACRARGIAMDDPTWRSGPHKRVPPKGGRGERVPPRGYLTQDRLKIRERTDVKNPRCHKVGHLDQPP